MLAGMRTEFIKGDRKETFHGGAGSDGLWEGNRGRVDRLRVKGWEGR